MQTAKEEREEKRRLSAYERLSHARNWLWKSWTDEAVMIYRRSAHGKDRARVVWVQSLLFIREIVREFYMVEGTSRAASLAYTTLLSLIPLLVAMTQILRSYFSKLFPDFNTQTDTFLNMLVPLRSSEIASHLSRFAENAQAASTFGAIIFLFISFRLFMAVEATVNQIWKVPDTRGYRQKIRAFTMLLFWGPLLIGMSFTTSASLERNPYLRRIIQSDFILGLVPLIVLFIAFTMLFWLVPATRVQFKSAAIGALITALAFELVRFGFGYYSEKLFTGRFNVIYGTLGLAVVFLVALELMWVIVLIGVQISYVHQNLPGLLRASEQRIEEDPKFNLFFAVRALIEITRRFERREDAPSSYRLAEEFGATDKQMTSVLRKLEDGQLVKEIGGDWTGFVPGFDPDRILIEEVVRQMEGGNRVIPVRVATSSETAKIADLFSSLDHCTTAALGKISIGQLVRELYSPRDSSRTPDGVVAR